MSYAERHRLTVTTSATSTANDFTPRVTGAFGALQYTVGTTAYTTTCTVTVTVEATGQVIFSSTTFDASTGHYYPVRMPIVNTAGTTVAGDAPIYLHNDRVKVLVANVGATKEGTFDVFIN